MFHTEQNYNIVQINYLSKQHLQQMPDPQSRFFTTRRSKIKSETEFRDCFTYFDRTFGLVALSQTTFHVAQSRILAMRLRAGKSKTRKTWQPDPSCHAPLPPGWKVASGAFG